MGSHLKFKHFVLEMFCHKNVNSMANQTWLVSHSNKFLAGSLSASRPVGHAGGTERTAEDFVVGCLLRAARTRSLPGEWN